ncbi:MAG TPA: metallophosphoesterase [Candidatus Nanoarchaeia archaeon]|nr:metallophosphoesterase [Candidatus Nanoarchaeia archaeon]
MNYKSLAALTFFGFLTGGMLGCKGKDSVESTPPFTHTIAGHDYRFEGNRVTQLTSDSDDQSTYGVISDAHGETAKAKYFANIFKERKVDGIILTGDLPKNEKLRYGHADSRDDQTEIKEVLTAVAQTKLPILTILGHHERKSDYDAALAEVTRNYPNVIDMTQYWVFDGDDVDFVSLPGYQTFKRPTSQFIPDDGFYADAAFINATGKLARGLDDAVVLIAHGAGKTGARVGPATLHDGKDVGNPETTYMMRDNNIGIAVVGHIHEAGGIAATVDGRNVPPGKWANQGFTVNFGTLESWRYLDGKVRDGMAGILTVKGDKSKFDISRAKYEILVKE